MTQRQEPMDRLNNQTRTGGSRMIIEGTDPQKVTQEQAQAVIEEITAYLAANQSRISRKAIAHAIGIGGPTLGQVLNWKYPGNWQAIILDLDKWLDDQKRRDAAPRTTEFVPTAVAQEIKTIADLAVGLNTIGLVYGQATSGIGKTMTLQAIRDEKAGSVLITIEKATATVPGLLKAIASELRISTVSRQSAYLYDRVKEVLVNSNRLLMIDQIHSLCDTRDDRTFYVLCDLHDATKSPQLWCGTADIVAYLDRRQAKGRDKIAHSESLAQIRRRIGIRRDLMARTRGQGGKPLYTVDEIRAIFARNKMKLAPDAGQFLCKLANLEDRGALGLVVKLVRAATIAHEMAAKVLTTDMLVAMLAMIESPATYQRLRDELLLDQRDSDGPISMAG